MQRMKTIIFTTVAALSLTLFAVLPINVQADGGDTTLIHACVAKDGTMRNVSATTACKNSETALHWVNVTRVTAIESKNTTQDSSIAAAVSTNNSQNTTISDIQTKDTQQDAAIQALQGQTGGGLRVVDSLGNLVGRVSSPELVVNQIPQVGSKPFLLAVLTTGFIDTGVFFDHTTTDCSGPRYMPTFVEDPFTQARLYLQSILVNQGQLIFPTGPFQQITVRSRSSQSSNLPANLSQSLPDCFQIGGGSFTAEYGTVGTLNLNSTLGVTPPFHVE